jgi:hypothetical protein
MEDRRKPNENEARSKKIMSNLNPYSAAMMLKTPSTFDAMVVSPKKNPISGNSGSLAQEIIGGYAEWRGLLPTAQTQGLKVCKDRKTVFMPLDMLPTPRANDIHHGKPGQPSFTHRKNRGYMAETVMSMGFKIMNTPTANDAKNSTLCPSQANRQESVVSDCLKAGITGQGSQLSPLFVAEMMGFPVEYLVLPFLDGESNPSKPSATPSYLR